MNKKFFYSMAIAAILLTACRENHELFENENVEIHLTSGVSVQTRAAYPGTDTQITTGEKVAVYVDEATGTKLYEKNLLTANGSGSFSGGTAMFFPQSGNNVNIYAFHTNATLANDYPATELTHTVNATQTGQAGYVESDLLYARSAGVARTASAINLTFFHLLSKMQIAVTPGVGLSAVNLEGATISIENTKLEAKFTPDKGTAAAANAFAITPDGSAKPITVLSTSVANDVSTDFGSGVKYHDAIIVPQIVNSGETFIKISLSNGGNLYYKPSQSLTFVSGKKYIYHITVNLTGLTVTSTITDWTAENAVQGDATM
jgi:hypothetical protein